jgi:hypothetical protein
MYPILLLVLQICIDMDRCLSESPLPLPTASLSISRLVYLPSTCLPFCSKVRTESGLVNYILIISLENVTSFTIAVNGTYLGTDTITFWYGGADAAYYNPIADVSACF